MTKMIALAVLISFLFGCASSPPRLSGSGDEWWDAHKNRSLR